MRDCRTIETFVARAHPDGPLQTDQRGLQHGGQGHGRQQVSDSSTGGPPLSQSTNSLRQARHQDLRDDQQQAEHAHEQHAVARPHEVAAPACSSRAAVPARLEVRARGHRSGPRR